MGIWLQHGLILKHTLYPFNLLLPHAWLLVLRILSIHIFQCEFTCMIFKTPTEIKNVWKRIELSFEKSQHTLQNQFYSWTKMELGDIYSSRSLISRAEWFLGKIPLGSLRSNEMSSISVYSFEMACKSWGSRHCIRDMVFLC